MAKLKLSVEDAIAVNNEIRNCSNEMGETINTINNEFNTLLSSYGLYGDTTVNSLVSSITSKINQIKKNMDEDFSKIYDFVGNRIIDYDEVFTSANQKLESALDKIKSTFGSGV